MTYRDDPEARRIYHQAYHRKHREEILPKQREYRRRHIEREQDCQLQRHYGLSLAEYDDMLESQDNGCAICGKPPEENGKRLSVDHDHETGKVRGLLCNCCNRGLGIFHDDIALMRDAIEYLEGGVE
jgi:hypothetical protein